MGVCREQATHHYWEIETKKVISARLGTTVIKWLQKRDAATFAHQLRVGASLMAVAETAGTPLAAQNILGCVGGLHDVGKITSRRIRRLISMPGTLTPDQHRCIAAHPRKGAEFLQAYKVDPIIVLPTYYHHATMSRLNELHKANPMLGEICMALQVADQTDAMTDVQGRPYLRERLPAEGLAKIDSAGKLHLDTDAIEQIILAPFPHSFTTLGITAPAIVAKIIDWKSEIG